MWGFSSVLWAGPQGERAVDALAKRLAGPDLSEVLNAVLPDIYAQFRNDDLTPFVKALWRMNRHEYPGVNWDLLQEPEARFAFGALWCQWQRARAAAEDVEEVRLYGKRFLDHHEAWVRAEAASLIGKCGKVADLALLKQFALHDRDKSVKSAAIFGIVSMLDEAAAPVLKELRGTIPDPEIISRVDALLEMIQERSMRRAMAAQEQELKECAPAQSGSLRIPGHPLATRCQATKGGSK